MSLNWNATSTPAYKAGNDYTQEQKAVLGGLPFWLVATGCPYDGMNDATINRVLAWQGVVGPLLSTSTGGFQITREMLKDFEGLRVNVGPNSNSEFAKMIQEYVPSKARENV